MKNNLDKRLCLIFFLAVIFAFSTPIRANTIAHAIWGVGVQIGYAELGANQGVSANTLAASLRYARDLARQVSCISDAEIESIRVAMTRTRNSRNLYSRIRNYRVRLTTIVSRNCRCSGSGNNALGLYGLGVQVGYAELGSFLGIASGTLSQTFQYAINFANSSNCVPSNELVNFRNAMRNTRNTRTLYSQILSYRQSLANYIIQSCNCENNGGSSGASGCNNISGTWRQNTSSIGTTTWTLASIGGNRYRTNERGLGNAAGTATFNRGRLRINFQTGNIRGYYIWNLNRNCSSGTGSLVFTAGRRGSYSSTVQKQ